MAMISLDNAYGHEDFVSSCWNVELSKALFVIELEVERVSFDWVL